MAHSQHPDLADATTNELLAMLEVMFLVAVADRLFSSEERRKFLEHAVALSGGKLDAAMLTRLVGSWEKRDLRDVTPRLDELARDLSDASARRIAYGLARSMAESDGNVAPKEAQLLARIAEAFGLDLRESAAIARSVKMSQAPPAPDEE